MQPRLKRRLQRNKMNFGIIAAGEGSRLAEEGFLLPKPLVTLGGEPIIGRLIEIFLRCGASSVSVVVNALRPEVVSYLESLQNQLPVPLYMKSATTPSSLHTFYELTRMLPGRDKFVVTTVDTIFQEEEFRKYVDSFRNLPSGCDGLMAVTDYIEDEKPLYVATDSEMDITSFQDTPSENVKFVSGGVYGLDNRAIGLLEMCLEKGMERMRNFQRYLLSSGLRLKAFPMGKIIDIDHVGDIARAEELLKLRPI